MNTLELSKQSLITLKRHALLVLFICYIPHITSQPAWLFLLLTAAIGYRLLADFFNFTPMWWWLRLCIVLTCLLVLGPHIFASGFFIRFLLTFIILKCLELNSVRDIKVLILCNFYLIFSALIVTQDLWIVVYLFMAIFANLSLMIKLSAPSVSLTKISSKSGQQLLIVIPLSLLLFYIFPRIDPLWHIQSLSKTRTGLDEQMDPGSISQLFNDDSTVMQVTFANPISSGYWRAITLSFYNGESWYASKYSYSSFISLPELKVDEVADYEILLEPNHIKWLLYQGYPVASASNLLFYPGHGLIRANNKAINERFGYALKVASPQYQPLSAEEHAEAVQLPDNINPRLSSWAKEQFANVHNDPKAFIGALYNYIHDQPFWYTLAPPLLNAYPNQMDVFWFETRKGFCEHYAGAVTLILRAAGIPARVILGYHGGKWNPLTHSITVKQYNAHAWVEYWLEGAGWRQLDPTSFIASDRVEQSIAIRQTDILNQGDFVSIAEAPWREKINILVDSMRFYTERWFLFYNQNTQQNLLQNVGLGRWSTDELLQVAVCCLPIFFMLIGLYYNWRQKRNLDPLLLQYHLLQQEFRRLHIRTPLSATVQQQCHALIAEVPDHATVVSSFMDRYEQLRLQRRIDDSQDCKKQTIALMIELRKSLRLVRGIDK